MTPMTPMTNERTLESVARIVALLDERRVRSALVGA